MAAGAQHPVIAAACLEFLPDEIAALCRAEPAAFRAGGLWPDAMGARFSCVRIGEYVLANGSLDAARIRTEFDAADNGVPATDEMAGWGLFSHPCWVVSHGAASPDFYARELARALSAGDGARAAFIVGFLSHVAEYTAHFKSQEAMLAARRTEGLVPVGVHKGQPFFRNELVVRDAFDPRAVADLARSEFVAAEERAGACQRRLVAEGVDGLFAGGLDLQRAIVTCADENELGPRADEFRALVARGMARTVEYVRAACFEAMAGSATGGDRRADILFLVRGNLWLRHRLAPPRARAEPGVARLRFPAALEMAGLDYAFASGDRARDLSRHPVIVSLEGWSFDGDAAVYESLRAAAEGGSKVLLVGEPHASRRAAPEWRGLVATGGVGRAIEVADMLEWLGADECRLRVNARRAEPPDGIIRALQEISAAPLERQLRLNDPGFLARAFFPEGARP